MWTKALDQSRLPLLQRCGKQLREPLATSLAFVYTGEPTSGFHYILNEEPIYIAINEQTVTELMLRGRELPTCPSLAQVEPQILR